MMQLFLQEEERGHRDGPLALTKVVSWLAHREAARQLSELCSSSTGEGQDMCAAHSGYSWMEVVGKEGGGENQLL